MASECSPSPRSMTRRCRRSASGHVRLCLAAVTLAAIADLLVFAPSLPAETLKPGILQSTWDTLVFAGCEANIPITYLLASGFRQKHPEVSMKFATVGSTNGIALAAARAVHVGLVSRPLRNAEELLGLTYRPYAKTAVVLATNPDSPDVELTTAELLSVYRGDKLRWDSDREIALLTREQGDSSVMSLKQALPGFAEAYAAGADTGRWTVLYSESTMHEALLMVPFALGLTDLGTVTIERLPIQSVPIDGIAPTLDNLAHGRYRFFIPLAFVWREDVLPDSARAFLEFVHSEEGASILRSHGYLPLR